jgi:predicted 3-demethylubiquinone-9 3-methyltransferase (glyoxalase superfamily)
MQPITPNLWFDGNAKEAAEFYTSVFKDGSIVHTDYYPTEGLLEFQKPLAGKELTVEFKIRDMNFIAINAGPEFKFNESVSFMVSCKDQAEIDYFWEKLSAVPESEQCGWCKDKYGLSWQIVPENMGELMKRPNAFEHMLSMKKIVVEDF